MRTKIVFVSGSRADFGLIQETLKVFSDSKQYSVTLMRIGHSLAEENDYYIIKLDELIVMEAGDFYDRVHTTPQGSDRIAETIYPYLKKILKKLDS